MTAAQKRLTLAAAILGSITAFIDSTVVNVALPRIRDDLGGGLAGQQWLTDAYLLTLGSLLLVGGALGDLHGRRRMFALGLMGFGVASVLCAVAPSIEALIVARALQGVAAALLVPNTLGLIVARFDASERGAAIGTWTAWAGIAMVIGPLAGGVLLESGSWRWIFAVNLIPIMAALELVRRLDATHDVPSGGRADHVGGVLATLGLGGPVYALIEGPARGWTDPVILVALVGGLAMLAAFVVFEERAQHPMLPLALFHERNFAVGNAATLAVYGGLGSVPFFLVLFLQQVARYTPIEAGLALVPVSAIVFALSRRWGALADQIGPRIFMGAGPLVAAAGLALFTRVQAGADYAGDVLPAVLVFGLGLSLTVAPLTATVLGGVTEEHAGIASAVNNATARIGGLFAVAAIGAVVSAAWAGALPGNADPQAFAAAPRAELRPVYESAAEDAFHVAMLATAGLVALGGVFSALGIENPRRSVPCEGCPGGAAVGAGQDPAVAAAR
jgi:EmrB/QacA subfamily drug resistance transporter